MKNSPDNKAKFLEKFDQPTKPVITQVVPVIEELTLESVKPSQKSVKDGKDHFNVYLSKEAGKALRIHKINTGEKVQDILERIIVDYLISKGELTSVEKIK